MAIQNHTPAADRFLNALQRVSATELDSNLANKQMTALERDLMRKAHAMLHGDVLAVDRWFMDYPEILDDARLTGRERRLADLVDTIAETA